MIWNILLVGLYRGLSKAQAKGSANMLWFLIVGVIAGWLAGNIMKGGGFGLIGDLVVGVVGAFIGGAVYSFLGFSAYGTIGEIIMATVGAVLLLWLLRLVR
jgi:uncharacterized membrane protein YeaQ/YmgE (transglycosylase-associated protein family)